MISVDKIVIKSKIGYLAKPPPPNHHLLVGLQLEEVDRLLFHKVEVVEVELQLGVDLQLRYLSQYRRLLQNHLQDRHHYHLRHQ
jgi:hypothetical protein